MATLAIPQVIIHGEKLVTTSKAVADFFAKPHKDILVKIRNLGIDCEPVFYERNFSPIEIEVVFGVGNVRKDPAFEMTKDGFMLLVMGFTGKQALAFKVAYIQRFNEMEAALKQPKNQLSLKDGQHFVVAKDGVVLYHKTLSKAVGKEALASLNNTNALIEHIREVMGEYIGKNELPTVKQDKFAALQKDLAHFCQPEDPYLQITYPTAQHALSMVSAILVTLEQHGLKVSLMYQKVEFVKKLLSNYYTRLDEASMQLNIIKRLVSVQQNPTVVSGQGVKFS